MTCSDDKKFKIVEEATKIFQDKGLKVLTIDGAFVELDDSTWGVVRCSNTAHQLTFRFESDTEAKLNDLLDLFYKVLSKFEDVDSKPILGLKV